MRNDWVDVELAAIAKIYSGTGFPKNYQGKTIGDYPFYKVGDISKNFLKNNIYLRLCDNYIDESECILLKAKIVPPQSVVFAKIGEALKLNRRGILYTPSIIDNNTIGVKAENAYLRDKLLYFFLLKVKFGNISRASVVPSIRKTDIESIRIPLPPLPEQRAIVTKLELLFSELDNAVESLKTARKKIELYRQSVLKKAFEDCEFSRVLLVDITTKIGSGATPKGGQSNYKEKGIPLIRSKNIHFNGIKYKDLAFIDSIQAEKLKNVIVKENDVLLNITGASIGRVYIAPSTFEGARVNQHVSIVRTKKNRLEPFFLKYYIESPLTQKWISIETYGVTRPSLTKTMIQNIEIPLPSLPEQQKIVEEIEYRLTVADKQLDVIDSSIEKAEALRQSILKRAFEGKLLSESELEATRLEPDWEPAEKLLQRIKDENKTKTTMSRTTKKKTTRKMTPVEMEALIVCQIIDAHQKYGNPEMVNHVKCEKIVHLAEYHAGFELERKPFKDAAGPNDYKTVKKVQCRAEKAGYFTTTISGYITTYFADRNIGKAISKLHEKVDKDKLDRLQQIIDDFISFDKVESEVPVTVYAAWNNLLLQNKEITDEAIVFEARENWHKNKMRIPRDEFFSALEWLREKNYIPTGSGIIIEKRDKDK